MFGQGLCLHVCQRHWIREFCALPREALVQTGKLRDKKR